jgi:hypothetical protein
MRPRARRRLRPGMQVWVWYCRRACRGVIGRRGYFNLRRYWVVAIDLDGATVHVYFLRRGIHLAPLDCANQL